MYMFIISNLLNGTLRVCEWVGMKNFNGKFNWVSTKLMEKLFYSFQKIIEILIEWNANFSIADIN